MSATAMNATERSIVGQFPLWATVPAVPPLDPNLPIVCVGCGSSFHLATSIAALLNETGRHAMAVPGGEWWLRPEASVPAGMPVQVIALSRSGGSTETVRAAHRSRDEGRTVLALTCEPGSALTEAADASIIVPTHPDEGIVMTAAASMTLLAGLRLAGHAPDPSVTAQAERLMTEVGDAAPGLLAGRDHFVFLGGGPLWGIAREGALKMQEMAQAMVESYPTLDYRHGPISLVSERTLVIMLAAPDAAAEETSLAGELEARGARVLGLGGPGTERFFITGPAAYRGVTLLPALQMLGERLAQDKGLDTTVPRGLNKVVRAGVRPSPRPSPISREREQPSPSPLGRGPG